MKSYPLILLLLIQCSILNAQSEPQQILHAEEVSVSAHEQHAPCLNDKKRQQVKKAIATNLKKLGLDTEDHKKDNSSAFTTFIWPVQKAAHSSANHVYGISNYVDHNGNFPDQLTDYNCGDRTYDLPSGYNHQGTDIYLWPFSWSMMAHDEAEVVAAADGQIIYKEGGQFDMNCGLDSTAVWNAVYLLHSDGSTGWYGHMKKNSLTNKQVGESVSQGEFLGVVGSSGSSTGPHLHFEVYDPQGNLIDPYFLPGGCNNMNNSSWWANQKSYFNSKLNTILIHARPPVFNPCPQAAEQNLQQEFIGPDTVYFISYFTDHLMGQTTSHKVYDPNGNIFLDWQQTAQAPYYSASYYYYAAIFPQNAPLGTYTYEAIFMNDTVSTEFEMVNACEITHLTFSNIECTSDSTFLVTIDFNYSDTSSTQFDISDRDSVLYTKPYDDLPVRVELPISGLTNEYVKVNDHDNVDCYDEGEFMVNCDSLACDIFHLELYNIECTSDSTYLVSIDFDYENVTNNLFDVSDRDGVLSTHPYDSLPIRIEVPISGHNYELLKVSDNDKPDCAAAEEFMVNCDSFGCDIFHLELYNIECTSDSTYLVSIDFDYENVTDNLFDVSDRDGVLSTHPYDSLPIRIEVPISGHNYELLKVSDNDNLDCAATEEFMANCDSSGCDIFHLELYNIECTSDSTYLVSIDFDYENVTNNLFDVSDRDGVLSMHPYDSLPIRIEVPVSGHNYELLKVSDNDNPDCAATEEFMVNCDSSECDIFHLELYNIECTSDSTYLVSIDFDYENVNSTTFDLFDRNGLFDSYPYDSLPIRVELPITGHNYELIKVVDSGTAECSDAEEFMVECDSSCHIYDLELSNIECPTDSTYLVTINFEYDNVTNTSFDVYDRDSLIGYYDYSDLPIRIELPASGHNFEYIKVSDNDNHGCFDEAEFEVECLMSSIANTWHASLKIAPNPTNEYIFVRGIDRTDYTIFTSIGQRVASGSIQFESRISLGELESGMYYIKFEKDDQSTVRSFIKL